jgi:hypothetical protein
MGLFLRQFTTGFDDYGGLDLISCLQSDHVFTPLAPLGKLLLEVVSEVITIGDCVSRGVWKRGVSNASGIDWAARVLLYDTSKRKLNA